MRNPRSKRSQFAAWTLLVALIATGVSVLGLPAHPARAVGEPNIVVIMVDDLDVRSYDAARTQPLPGGGTIMPNLQNLSLDAKTTNFKNFFVSYPLCCPSRATFLTGQYAHNHLVYGNGDAGQIGGCVPFMDHEDATVAKWLKDSAAQYRTGIFGKYLNGYGDNPGMPTTSCKHPYYTAQGWDYWEVLAGWRRGPLPPAQGELKWGNPQSERNFMMNIQGSVGGAPGHGSLVSPTVFTQYQTNKLSADAVAFINEPASLTRPFFLYVAPTAPHRESGHDFPNDSVYTCTDNIETTPSIRADDLDDTLADSFSLPADGQHSFNESPITDKPSWVANLPSYGDPVPDATKVACTTRIYQDRLESLRAVDDLVGAIRTATSPAPNNLPTVIMFTSDNGFYLGEHRAQQKELAYEEGIRVPLLVNDPRTPASCPAHRDLFNFIVNTDLAPTILGLAGATLPPVPDDVDGQSFKNLLEPSDPNCVTLSVIRRRFLIEHVRNASAAPYPTFSAMRTLGPETLYLETVAPEPFEKEFYDLDPAAPGTYDQWQLTDTSDLPTNCLPPGMNCAVFADRLHALTNCGKDTYATCESLENGIWP